MSYDLIIIGGGPAGVAAGIYAARQKINTLLITKEFGGQMAKKAVMIENYPGFEEISGLELTQKFERHLRKNKIDIERDEVSKIVKMNLPAVNGGVSRDERDTTGSFGGFHPRPEGRGIPTAEIKEKFIVTSKSKNKFESKAVIIASGSDPRPLEVPGEKEFIGKGVSYCVTCDGPLFENKNVAVIGGGNAGFEAALFLSEIAKRIYILESGNVARADAENQGIAAKLGNIEVLLGAEISEIKGDKFVRSITYKDKKNKKNITLQVDGVFVEIGSQPATSFARGLVDLNERDEIIVDAATLRTKTAGLFAAGDANIGKFKQIATAVGEGTQAALAASEYLRKL